MSARAYAMIAALLLLTKRNLLPQNLLQPVLGCRSIALRWQSDISYRSIKLGRRSRSELSFRALRLNVPSPSELCFHAVSTSWRMTTSITAPRKSIGPTAVDVYSVELQQLSPDWNDFSAAPKPPPSNATPALRKMMLMLTFIVVTVADVLLRIARGWVCGEHRAQGTAGGGHSVRGRIAVKCVNSSRMVTR